jgi:hypothetical protein
MNAQHPSLATADIDADAGARHPPLALPLEAELEGLPAWPGPLIPSLVKLPPLTATGGGRPGASSTAAYRRRREAERRAWRASLRWRLAAAVAVGALVTGPRLAWSNGIAAAAGVALTLRFRPSTATRACREGARGERRTARLLAPLEHEGSVVLHDLALSDPPVTGLGRVGQPQPPNFDHLAIGASGVFLIDSLHCQEMLRVDTRERLWHRGEPLDGVLEALRRGAREVTVALADGQAPVRVQPMLSVHGSALPWLGELPVGGVLVLEAAELPRALRVRRQVLTPDQVAHLAARARASFQPAAS